MQGQSALSSLNLEGCKKKKKLQPWAAFQTPGRNPALAFQAPGRNPAMSMSTAPAVYLKSANCSPDLHDVSCEADDVDNLPALTFFPDAKMCVATFAGASGTVVVSTVRN